MHRIQRLALMSTIMLGLFATAENTALGQSAENNKLYVPNVYSANANRLTNNLSFLRIYNNGASGGRVRVKAHDSDGGAQANDGLNRDQTYNSPIIPPGTSTQIRITDIEHAICSGKNGIDSQCPIYLMLELSSDFDGFFQHVLYSDRSGFITNMSACSRLGGNTDKAFAVHSSLLTSYPAQLIVHDNPKLKALRPNSARLGFYNSKTGARLFGITTSPIHANGSSHFYVPEAEAVARYTPGQDEYHYIVKIEGIDGTDFILPDGELGATNDGFELLHIVRNLTNNIYVDMTMACSLTSEQVGAPWDGILIKNDSYKPYDTHLNSYGLTVAGLPDVIDNFLTNVGNITNKILAPKPTTDKGRRDTLLQTFVSKKVFQRVGSTNMGSYEPPLNEDNYPGWDYINDNYLPVDFVWEATCKSPREDQTNPKQINGILEHLLHTITRQFSFVWQEEWGYLEPNSDLTLAMNEAINAGFYDVLDYGNNTTIKAQEFAYWVILTGWNLKTAYAPDSAPEWAINNSAGMQLKLPLAYKLFKDTVEDVLTAPTKEYLDTLLFESLICGA